MLLAQAGLGGVPSPLAMKARSEILLFPIVVIISLIPYWTSASFAASTAITTTTPSATLVCKEQSFGSKPNHSLDCSFLFDELGDELIRVAVIVALLSIMSFSKTIHLL
jgi:hypothetical protein